MGEKIIEYLFVNDGKQWWLKTDEMEHAGNSASRSGNIGDEGIK